MSLARNLDLLSRSASEQRLDQDIKEISLRSSLAFLAPASLAAKLRDSGLDAMCVIRPDSDFLALERIGAGTELSASIEQLEKLPIGILLAQEFSSPERERLAEIVPPFPSIDPSLYCAQGVSVAEIAGWMARRSIAAAAAFGDHLARASAEIARLQRFWREQEEALRRVEAALEAAGGGVERLAVFFPPGAANASLSRFSRDFPIIQKTRRLFHALGGVELFFIEPGQSGLVRVEAKGAFSGKSLAVWTVPEHEIAPGWNRFNTPSERSNPLAEAIAIVVSSDSEAVARVALGEATAEPGLGAQAGSETKDRPLALRLYEGVAGFAARPGDFGFAPDGAPQQPLKGRVRGDRALARAALVYPAKGIVRLEGEAGLLVHPVTGKRPTIGVIRGVSVGGLCAVSVEIALKSERAPPVDFGVLVLEAQEAAFEPRAGLLDKLGVAGESSLERKAAWLRLQGMETGRLTYEAPRKFTGRVDVFLMTRSSTGVADYAWAYFQGLTLVFSD